MNIHKRTKEFIKTFTVWELCSTIDPYKNIKTEYTYSQLLIPPRDAVGPLHSKLHISSPSVRLHRLSFVRCKSKTVWALQENSWQGDLGLTTCLHDRCFHASYLWLKRGFQPPSSASLTTLLGIGTSPNIHEYSKVALLSH
jgi:hypothetical protein